MSMFNDIIWRTTDNEQECIANATFVSLFAKRFPAWRWAFLGPGSETKWYSTYNERPRGEWDRVAEFDDDQIRRKRTLSFSSNESVVSKNTQKQKRWKIIFSLLCRWWCDWNCSSHNHFCQSAQYLRDSIRFVWEVQYLSNKNRETRVDSTICPIVRASKIIDNNTCIFDWNSCTRKFIAKAQRTSSKASTTRSIDWSLCWCRIPEMSELSWSRTILHDKSYWRVFPNCGASDMSWVYVIMRWQINWPERLDSRELQNWSRSGSHIQ